MESQEGNLSADQASVLEALPNDGIGVVRAGPGSGKTRVFAEVVRRKIGGWNGRSGGVAVLSFTNVAHEEVSMRLGGPPGGPHFIGTIDSFFWRFVVRPFGHLEGVSSAGAVLVPAPLDAILDEPKAKVGAGQNDWESIFRLSIRQGNEATPEIVKRDRRLGPIKIRDPFRGWALKKKEEEWRATGRITHSDSQYLASRILRGAHGKAVIRLLSSRFPTILVDEFQDTGWFLGRALFALLAEKRTSAILVGDPDQAIYQFGGAYRELFDDAERLGGRPAFPLNATHRCSKQVSRVATMLSRSKKTVVPLQSASDGSTIIVVHQQSSASISVAPILDALASALETQACKSLAVLARKTETVRRLASKAQVEGCPWDGGAGRRFNVAVERALAGEFLSARMLFERELCQLVFEQDRVGHELLREKGIDRALWRRVGSELLIEACKVVADETWNQWMVRLKRSFLNVALRIGWAENRQRIGARFKGAGAKGDVPRLAGVVEREKPLAARQLEIATVHQVKGRSFDAVVLFVPKPHKQYARCPSEEWWSADPSSEEMEVAFVACSRARRLLAIALHDETYRAMCQVRGDFVKEFEIVDLRPYGAEGARTDEPASDEVSTQTT